MRFISTQVHGVLDYIIGVLLILAPWVLGFAEGGAATWLPVIIGAAIIIYSLFTDYEFGMVRQLSMRAHLWLDGILGALLAVSPWLFNFDEFVWIPHVLVGVVLVLAALFTHVVPGRLPYGGATGRPRTV